MPARPPIPPERLARALTLLSYLLEESRGERVPLSDIRRDLAIEPAEVREDLSLLNLVNWGGGSYIMYGEVIDDHVVVDRWPEGDEMAAPARLSPLMAKSLLLALDLVGASLPVEEGEALASARVKVESLVGDSAKDQLKLDDLAPVDERVLVLLNRALRDRLLVTMRYYTSTREELSERVVEPYLLRHTGGRWYLDAFCLQAGAERTFRLDFIRSAELTGQTFVPRADVDLSTKAAGVFSVVERKPRWAVLRFPEADAPALLEQGLETLPGEEGTIRVRIPYLGEAWLVGEVLRQGGRAVLEEPAELRSRVAQAAADLLRTYRAENT